MYVGKGTNLRTRAKHHKLKTQGSTFRRSLAGLMGMQAEWFGSATNHGLIAADEATLTSWMTNNLSMSSPVTRRAEDLSGVEYSLLLQSRVPLNRDGLSAEQLHTSARAKVLKHKARAQKCR
ncbi:GIY-YIG nuclease family protein [Arthrobacter sp. JZ12]|uniref:GIY-YIG nuclease family protein n=1 Tax=Arthrobacter sp. JZ12 TaxID=2654190 RepID=UPI003A5D0E82